MYAIADEIILGIDRNTALYGAETEDEPAYELDTISLDKNVSFL